MRWHRFSTSGQRGLKVHPEGRSVGSGGSPSSPLGRIRYDSSPMVGKAAARARVYGCLALKKTSSAGPSSTTRPAYITASRSQTAVSTDRSWVMNSMVSPRSARSPASRASTWAWTIRSRAVVGSSATSSSGSQASAMAMSTRCRWPPDSSWA